MLLTASLLALQGLTWVPLPYVVYGAVSILVGVVTCALPETLRRRLPETLDDVENFHRYACTLTHTRAHMSPLAESVSRSHI